MDRVSSLESHLRKVMRRYDIMPRKRFGQNFLADPVVLDTIVEAARLTKDDIVIEIGPGLGVLTRELAYSAGSVIAIELDKDLFAALQEETADLPNMYLLNADVLQVDLRDLLVSVGDSFSSAKIVANLPYNITTSALTRLVSFRDVITVAVVMVQKEVALRIAAAPGSRDYGAFSVFMQMYTDVSPVCDVPPQSFVPQPKVHSAVIRIDMRPTPKVATDEALFFRLVKSAFQNRRKTLLNSLKSLPGMGEDAVRAMCARAGIDGQRRAETLSLYEFSRLAEEYVRML